MPLNLDALVINIFVSTIVVSPVLWLSGRLVVGGQKAKFGDALLIVVIGTVIGALFGALFVGVAAALIQLILWLALIRHYFECGWGTALVISIFAIIVFIGVGVVLGLIGFALFTII